MPDRVKVIRGLECCNAPNRHEGCPYDGAAHYNICTHHLLTDAIALLKEQETEYKPDGPDFIDGRMFTRWKCTSCQYFVCTEKGPPDMKYCPNCGRKVKR